MMNLLLNGLGVEYLVLDKDNNLLFQNFKCVDPSVIMEIINDSEEGKLNIFKSGGNVFQLGKISDDKYTVYYAQDVTKLVSKYQKLERDCLTKLYLRGVALPLMDDYLNHALNKGESFSLVMCDIDFFKKVNDTFGHDVGDEVLKYVAETLKSSFRSRRDLNISDLDDDRKNLSDHQTDVMCRYGGEEFLILLKDISLDETIKRVEEIRKTIEASCKVTMSFGVVNVKPDKLKTELLASSCERARNNFIKEADNALYSSKNNGRNVVSFVSEDGCMQYRPDEISENKVLRK